MKTLKQQFKSLIRIEEKLDDSRRALSQWQLLTTKGRTTYLIGKGGLNTIFYKINDGELHYCYPDDMLQLIDSWDKQTYSSYGIVKKKKLVKESLNLEELLKCVGPDFMGCYIVGIGEKNKRLYKMTRTLYDTYVWQECIK